MASYHVYFDAAPGIAADDLVAQVHSFMDTQVAVNRAASWRLLQMTNKATFQEMSDYHLIVDYASDADLQHAFAEMKRTYREEPHLTLMRMVTNFRVAFSTCK
jgi:hypothetical protein